MNLEIKGEPCSVGFGWHPIIQELSDVLDAFLGDAGWYPMQIKEKFGTLRFYVGYGDKNEPHTMTDKEVLAQKIVDRYEQASSHVCEICGAYAYETKAWRARPTMGGWVRTLCALHGAEALIKHEQDSKLTVSERIARDVEASKNA